MALSTICMLSFTWATASCTSLSRPALVGGKEMGEEGRKEMGEEGRKEVGEERNNR